MNLIVGATGRLGGEICRVLMEHGTPVRVLVRDTSDPDKVEWLRDLGAKVLRGDLKNRASLAAACRGASAVVSTASSMVSREKGDSIATVDHLGQLNLVDAAEEAGVKHFVLISFPTVDVDFPLQNAKRAVEDRLRRGVMTFTALQPTFFTESWLSPAMGFDPAHAAVRIYGDGHNKISWISMEDVARFAAAALHDPLALGQVVKLGGPDALSPLEVVRLAERVSGRSIVAQHVPEAALRAQFGAATDPLQQSLAGLRLYYVRGDVIDMAETLRALPVQRLKSVLDYLRAI